MIHVQQSIHTVILMYITQVDTQVEIPTSTAHGVDFVKCGTSHKTSQHKTSLYKTPRKSKQPSELVFYSKLPHVHVGSNLLGCCFSCCGALGARISGVELAFSFLRFANFARF